MRSEKAWINEEEKSRGSTEARTGFASPKTGPLYPAAPRARTPGRTNGSHSSLYPGTPVAPQSLAGEEKKDRNTDRERRTAGPGGPTETNQETEPPPPPSPGLAAPLEPCTRPAQPGQDKVEQRQRRQRARPTDSFSPLTWRVSASRRGRRATAPGAALLGPGCS